jgi:CheY-like chemotaxis protein
MDTSPELVLMDIRMPELDGIEATSRLAPKLPATRRDADDVRPR